MKKSIALSLCLAFVASVAFAFPPGMPPKENPLVTKVAPEKIGGFISWQGTAAADASSTNKVEQVLTKPAVKEELAKIKESFVKSFDSNPVAQKCIDLALDNGACVLFDKKDKFAGLISLGEDGPEVIAQINAEVKKAAAAGMAKVSSTQIGKMTFNKVIDSENNDLYWGALGKGKVLVFANNEKCLLSLLANARTPEPKWVADAKKDLGIERLSTLTACTKEFLNENAPASDSASDSEDGSAAMGDFMNKFGGGDYVEHIVAAAGLDKIGSVHKAVVYMKDGWKSTLPGIMIDKPLAEKDLSVIPSDATFALAGKTDVNKLFKSITESEDIPAEMKMQMGMLSMMVSPYLNVLGDSWAFFCVGENGASESALVWSLRNPAMAKIQLKNLMEMLKSNMSNMQKVEQIEIDDMGMNNLPRFIPTQLQLDDEEEEDTLDLNNLPPGVKIKVGQLPPGAKIQVVPGGQLPPGVQIPGGAVPQGAVPLGGGQIQLGGGGIDPGMLMGLMQMEIEKIKIDGIDFWMIKMGDDETKNVVIGIANKNLVITSKSYAEKYVKFDGTKNIGSNKDVARMMSNNPSYLLYTDSKSLVSLINATGQFSGSQLSEGMVELITASELPIVAGIYSTDNAVRIDANSGLPLPDMIISLGFLGISAQSNE